MRKRRRGGKRATSKEYVLGKKMRKKYKKREGREDKREEEKQGEDEGRGVTRIKEEGP